MDQFKLVAPYAPNGDQPQAIQELVDGIKNGVKEQIIQDELKRIERTPELAHLLKSEEK